MESGSLSTPDFAKFTDKVVPYLHVTTHVEGHPGEELSKTYGIRGFPTLKFLDAEGQELTEPNGRDVASFQATQTNLAAYADLKRRVDAGEKGLGPKLLLAEIGLGKVKFPEAQARFAKMKKLKPAVKADLEVALLNSEVTHLLDSIGRDEEKSKEVGAKFAAMVAEKRIPTGDSAIMFWSLILNHAETTTDAKLYKKALDFFVGKFGDEKRYEGAIKRLKETYEKLQGEKIG